MYGTADIFTYGQKYGTASVFRTSINGFLNGGGVKVYTISHGANRKWGKVSARTKRLPDKAKKVRVCLVVPQGAKGKVFFDDVSFRLFKVEPVTAMCSSCYRNEAVIGEPPVVFFAGIDLDDTDCTMENADIVFSFDGTDGTRKRRKASKFDGVDASVEIDPAEMKLGEQEIAAEVVRKNDAGAMYELLAGEDDL